VVQTEHEEDEPEGVNVPSPPDRGPAVRTPSRSARNRNLGRALRKANREAAKQRGQAARAAVVMRERLAAAERRRNERNELDHVNILENLNNIVPLVEQPEDIPTSWQEAYDTLIGTAVKLHLVSRPLARLPPVRRWSKPLLNAWIAATDRFGPDFLTAVECWENDKDPEPLTRAYINLLALPGHIIVNASNLVPAAGEVFIEHPAEMGREEQCVDLGNESLVERRSRRPEHIDPKETQAGGDPLARQAATLLRKDRQKIAVKVLTGNGVARRSVEMADLMQSMHLDYGKPAVTPDVEGEQLQLSQEVCEKELRDRAGTPGSIGVFGWADDMLLPIKGDDDNPLISGIAKLMTLIAEGNVPKGVAFLAVTGGLSALNKIPAEENERRVQSGQKPKARPVNNGQQSGPRERSQARG